MSANTNGEWTRLPTKPGERLQGLSRGTIYTAIATGLVKTACVKQTGRSTGVRLVHLPSLTKYIEGFTENPANFSATAANFRRAHPAMAKGMTDPTGQVLK